MWLSGNSNVLAAGKYYNDFIIIFTPNAHKFRVKDADGKQHSSLTLIGFVSAGCQWETKQESK